MDLPKELRLYIWPYCGVQRSQVIILSLLDASKAFDVVWHNSTLENYIYTDSRQGTVWLLMKDWYTDTESAVQWEGKLSKPFNEYQGVHHGGIWSPTAYKMFLNQALDLFEKYRLGFKIGNIHVGSESCADDQLLLSSQDTELLTMLKVQQNTQMKKDTNSASKKSKITIFNCRPGLQ